MVYFAVISSPGLDFYFNPDDSTNLFKAWILPWHEIFLNALAFWRGSVRPVGQLYYRAVYEFFGWNPYPFRLTCLIILETNLILLFFFLRKVSRSWTFWLLALLTSSFAGALWNIYCSTGTVYDMLCLTFTLLALDRYAALRSNSQLAQRRDAFFACVATIAAFESKELGFTVPVLLVAFELIFHGWPTRKVIFGSAGFALAGSTLCAAIGVAGLKMSKNNVFFAMPGYTPTFTAAQYLDSLSKYLHLLLLKTIAFSPVSALLTATASPAVAVLVRSRMVQFGWVIFMVTMLPLCFAPARLDGYVLYVPYVGVAIYFAGLIELGMERISSVRLRWVVAGFACLLIVLLQFEQREAAPAAGFGPGGMIWIEQLTEYAQPRCAGWKPRAKVAVVDNPFGEHWQPVFVINLTCRRSDLDIVTVQSDGGGALESKLPSPFGSYASVALYRDNSYRNLTAQWLSHQTPR